MTNIRYGVYGDNVGDGAGYKFLGNADDVVDCLENLETWNSRWGKAALSWAALRKLEVPTWHITIHCNPKHLCIADSPQRPSEGSGDHLRCCLSSESLRLVGPSLFKY